MFFVETVSGMITRDDTFGVFLCKIYVHNFLTHISCMYCVHVCMFIIVYILLINIHDVDMS